VTRRRITRRRGVSAVSGEDRGGRPLPHQQRSHLCRSAPTSHGGALLCEARFTRNVRCSLTVIWAATLMYSLSYEGSSVKD